MIPFADRRTEESSFSTTDVRTRVPEARALLLPSGGVGRISALFLKLFSLHTGMPKGQMV